MKKWLLIIFIIILYGCCEGIPSEADLVRRSKNYPVRILLEPINICEAGDFESADAADIWEEIGSSMKIIGGAGRNNSKGAVIEINDVNRRGGFQQSVFPKLKFSDIILEGWVKTENLNSGSAMFAMDYWAYDIERNEYRSDVYNPLWW
ncbi:MAG: hypothetical protein V1709_01390, partial [Planctomycetota bacterium]